jgi:hypothetical protein
MTSHIYYYQCPYSRWIEEDYKYMIKIFEDIEKVEQSDIYDKQDSIKLFFQEQIKKSIQLESKWKYRMKKYPKLLVNQGYYIKLLSNVNETVTNFIIQREEELGINQSPDSENIPLCEVVINKN